MKAGQREDKGRSTAGRWCKRWGKGFKRIMDRVLSEISSYLQDYEEPRMTSLLTIVYCDRETKRIFESKPKTKPGYIYLK